MPTLFEVRERSTQPFQVETFDDAGDPVIPIAAKYTLTDRDGTVINSVEDTVITPSLDMIVYLTDLDLQIIDQSNDREYRLLTVETDRGDITKPENIQTPFWVKNLKAIT